MKLLLLTIALMVNAGPDRVAPAGEISLHAEVNNPKAAVAWSIVQAPDYHQASIRNYKSLTPTLIAPVEGKYVLIVIAGTGNDQPLVSDMITITAVKHIAGCIKCEVF